MTCMDFWPYLPDLYHGGNLSGNIVLRLGQSWMILTGELCEGWWSAGLIDLYNNTITTTKYSTGTLYRRIYCCLCQDEDLK